MQKLRTKKQRISLENGSTRKHEETNSAVSKSDKRLKHEQPFNRKYVSPPREANLSLYVFLSI